MKILHYALGFPPYRSGGLTKFVLDLMIEQVENGNRVALLWPGEMKIINTNVYVKKHLKYQKIENYELINPLPVPLDEGIINVKEFTSELKNDNIYYSFLAKVKPDIIHIHTLMGIHKEFFLAAKKLRIKMVFTTHDYFGICPRVTLFYNNKACECENFKNCYNCNINALSKKKIILLQSPIYRYIKNNFIIKKIRLMHRKRFSDIVSHCDENRNQYKMDMEYKILQDYYICILNLIDIIHFNSTVSEKIYKKYFTPKNSVVRPITHKDIKDYRYDKVFDSEILRITYLSPLKQFKGFNLLKKTLDYLWINNCRKFQLSIFSEINIDSPYLKINPPYRYSELAKIFENTDLLVVPSVWHETFGFTVLEALSYGVPVIVSSNVGAKDLLEKEDIFVFEPNFQSLTDKIVSIYNNRNILEIMNKKILSLPKSYFNGYFLDFKTIYSMVNDNYAM